MREHITSMYIRYVSHCTYIVLDISSDPKLDLSISISAGIMPLRLWAHNSAGDPTMALVSDMHLGRDGTCSWPCAFVSDMAAPARPRQGFIYHAHMFSHNGYGPGSKDQGPRPKELLGQGPGTCSSLGFGPCPYNPLWLNRCA